jgi:nicotinate-nucleotide adenylyltransferase
VKKQKKTIKKKSPTKTKSAKKAAASKPTRKLLAKKGATAKKMKAVPQKTAAKKAAPSGVTARKAPAAPKSSEKIGILGGAFNPVHVGHLNAAMTVREQLKLDRVVLVPALNPPHREIAGPPAETRLEMVKRAVRAYEPELGWDDQEIRRGGTSYTVETLKAYNKTHDSDNIYFIMGADAFAEFPNWKDFETLIGLAHFVITTRPGSHVSLASVDLPMGLGKYVKASDRNMAILSTGKTIRLARLDDVDVSATEVRKKLRANHDIKQMVPPGVFDFINEKALYKRTSPLVKDYKEFSIFCSEKALDKKALALKLFDMTRLNSFADYSIICSATSSKHASSVGHGIVDAVKEEYGLSPISFEGIREGLWVLIDFGAVVIHVFEDTVRAQYNLEGLLRNCPQIQNEVPGFRETPGNKGVPQHP